MPSLGRIKEQDDHRVDWHKDAKRLREVGEDAFGLEQARQRPDEDCEMKQEKRITQIGNDLAQQDRPFPVIFCQQLEALAEASALLTRVEQRDVESRQPAA